MPGDQVKLRRWTKTKVLAVLREGGVLPKLPNRGKDLTADELLIIAKRCNLVSNTGLADLPTEVLRKILLIKARDISGDPKRKHSGPAVLFNLAATCKALHKLLKEDGEIWRFAWNSFRTDVKRPAIRDCGSTPVRERLRLRLLAFNGCMICRVGAIRKVYWKFGLRCCADCFTRHTVQIEELDEVHQIPFTALSGIRSMEYQQYDPFGSDHVSVEVYWKDDLDGICREWLKKDSWADVEFGYIDARTAAEDACAGYEVEGSGSSRKKKRESGIGASASPKKLFADRVLDHWG